jgi:hypothetical protein
MLGSALSALSDRLDSKFLTAYWLPAFVAVFGWFGILTVIVGPSRMEDWVYNLGSVEQTIAVLVILLAITMAAFVLRALSRPISEAFAGAALPKPVADWSARAQRRAKTRIARALEAAPGADASSDSAQQVRRWLDRVYPTDDADVQPTLLGNVFATAAEYPQLVYTMQGLLWWPRLVPLVPGAFSDMLGGAQAPMMALLNLCIVFASLALGGGLVLALAGGHWVAALVTLVGGLVLARLCYRAAVSQAAELGSMLRVGFDLYRHEILRQMDLEIPTDLDAERAIWHRLTAQMIGLPLEQPAGSDAPAAPAEAKQDEAKAADAPS